MMDCARGGGEEGRGRRPIWWMGLARGACRKLFCNTLGASTVMMVAAGEVEVDEAAGRVGDRQKPAARLGVYK